jgi:hypothetical protein
MISQDAFGGGSEILKRLVEFGEVLSYRHFISHFFSVTYVSASALETLAHLSRVQLCAASIPAAKLPVSCLLVRKQKPRLSPRLVACLLPPPYAALRTSSITA